MYRIIMTADYEMFGDGSGSVHHCVVAPSERLMSVCEDHGTRVTFFADVCEIWSFDAAEKQAVLEEGCRPGTAMREQLRGAIRRT